MLALCNLVGAVGAIIWWVLLLGMIMSWLIVFNILNTRAPAVYHVHTTLQRIIDPMLRPIQRFIPSVGGLDLSPIVLLLLVQVIQDLMRQYVCSAGLF
jgi:YggT family protein